MAKKRLSIIIPCFNEGITFEQNVTKIVSVLNKNKYDWEIIFVEDKSLDITASYVSKMLKTIKNTKAIFHSKNMGRGKAVKDGIKAAKGDICGFLDVDLEVSESYIPIFVSEIEKGYDMAVGKRFYEGGDASFILRFLASKIYAFIIRVLLNVPVDDTEAGYKFFRRVSILPVIGKTRDNYWFFDTEICARAHWAGLSLTQVPVLFVRRPEKKSTVRLLPDTIKYFLAIFKFRLYG